LDNEIGVEQIRIEETIVAQYRKREDGRSLPKFDFSKNSIVDSAHSLSLELKFRLKA
jgi:hypothetical protein